MIMFWCEGALFSMRIFVLITRVILIFAQKFNFCSIKIESCTITARLVALAMEQCHAVLGKLST